MSQDGSSRGARTFDAQEPVKLRDYAYLAAAGLSHIAARSSDTDPLSPDGNISQRAGGDNFLLGQYLQQARDSSSRLREFRAFRGANVLVQEQNLSFLWWGTSLLVGMNEWRDALSI